MKVLTTKNLSVAICLSTFNGEQYLAPLLDSLEAQNVENLEIIIRDDCSTDSTLIILQSFRQQSKHRVFLIDSFANVGPSISFFRLLSATSHDLVLFCDQDDIWENNKVSTFLDKLTSLESQSFPCILFSSYYIFGKLFPQTLASNLLAKGSLLFENSVPGFSIGINRSAVEYILHNITEGACSCFMHDWLILLACLQCNASFVHIDFPLVHYRQHSSNCIGIRRRRPITIKLILGFLNSSRLTFQYLRQWFPELLAELGLWRYVLLRLLYKLRLLFCGA